ncbi:Flp family type IVb pilin [Zhengella mangrovi]|uniref:Flp family type IVb pilin n=1 Tax=Zhengella mangrovi TaxID=1982044 RepID=A0A2G1QJD0_9HYPH|nr:Flp family type IVb pilin [Zhengella mangrovi]PHP65612.1 Flp family type IVb pilin [Zhengella mangrovi]
MMHLIKTFLLDERAATSIEYALIASIISIGFLASAGSIGSNLILKFKPIETELQQ